MIKKEVSESTSSMTAVPKPLKFLTSLYPKLTETYEKYTKDDMYKVSDFSLLTKFKKQKKLSDLCSVIGMVASVEESSDQLDYCLKGSLTNLHEWGHEYLRSLAGQIGKHYNLRVEQDKSADDLMKVVDIIVPQFINHNEEPEAVDLMMETESLSKLGGFCNERNYDRVCRYLCSCSQYAADTEEMIQSYTTAYDIYLSQRQYPDALRVAQKMNNMDLIKNVMEKCPDPVTKKQMAFMLGRQRNPYESEDDELNQIIA